MRKQIKQELQQSLILRLAPFFFNRSWIDDIIIENIEIEGQGVSNEAGFYHMKVADIDENGAMVGKEKVSNG
ncbi:MAG: hypothetical protein CM15mP119_2110 [Alphaproteobacteria bacterium]|nr:MAG: hypothetical protein CM15mP119_2110 [Alphaproteobacteria bacterium]